MIRPYLSDMIINYKTQGEWEIQLEMSINFISSDDSDETRNLCTKSNNGVVTQQLLSTCFNSRIKLSKH